MRCVQRMREMLSISSTWNTCRLCEAGAEMPLLQQKGLQQKLQKKEEKANRRQSLKRHRTYWGEQLRLPHGLLRPSAMADC